MLLVGIPNKESIPGVLNLIKKNHIGGVILYKNNYSSLDEMISLINKLKEANKDYDIPLTIAIDQEGGRVNRLPKDIHNLNSAYRLCNASDESVIKGARITSSILNKLGINMNFSPVLDVRSQSDDNAFIGNRAFSKDINKISLLGEMYVNEHIKNDVIPVIKHYPGHGNINVDSHFLLPIIRNFSKNRKDIIPFRYLMEKDVPAIMVGHILIKNYTKLKPATLSREFVTDFIINEEKYNNLIITDELGMRAIRLFYGKYRPMKLAFLAGNDLICCKYSNNYIEKCLDMLTKYIDSVDIDDSFSKIIKYKKKFRYNDELITNDLDIDEINKEIDNINNI